MWQASCKRVRAEWIGTLARCVHVNERPGRGGCDQWVAQCVTALRGVQRRCWLAFPRKELYHYDALIRLLWQSMTNKDISNTMVLSQALVCRVHRCLLAWHAIHFLPFITNRRTQDVCINNRSVKNKARERKTRKKNSGPLTTSALHC